MMLRLMAYVLTGIVLILVLYGIAKLASGDRYAKMTEEEFEKEAQRSSSLSAGVVGLQKIIDPGHRVEYAQEQQQRVEADSAESGDKPHGEPRVPPKPPA